MKRIYPDIKAYDMGEGWFVDIVDDGYNYTAYLYCGRFGEKRFMFAMPKKQQNPMNLTIFKQCVQNTWFDYIDSYIEEEDCLADFWENYDYDNCECDEDDNCICCPVCGSKNVELIEINQED